MYGNRLNIVLHTDETFAMQACTMILSVCENNKSFEDIIFYIIDTGMLDQSKQKIKNMVEKYNRHTIYIDPSVLINSLNATGINPYQGINMGVYLKGMLNLLLPIDVDRFIYIDCDAVVNESLKELWEIDLEDKAIGLAVDCMNRKIKEGYGFKGQYYYNTGVLLIDLINWNKRKCDKKYKQYILANKERKFEWADQDLINASLSDDCIKLSARYNWISLYEIYSYKELNKIYGLDASVFYSMEEYEAAKNKPIIYHFPTVFIGRPWFKNNLLPSNSIYDKYLYSDNNPWNEYQKEDKDYPRYTNLQRWMYKVLPRQFFVFIQKIASAILSRKITYRK